MSESLRDIKNRIRSIENTKKITNAMQMVSMQKLDRVDRALYIARPYFKEVLTLLDNLLGGREGLGLPCLKPGSGENSILLLVIASDNGLCGVYNNNIISLAEDFIKTKAGQSGVRLIVLGSRGVSYFKKKGANIIKDYTLINGRYSDALAGKISRDLSDEFLNGRAREVYIAYTLYKTGAIHQPVIEKYLNIEPRQGEEIDFILEPDINGILEKLIPVYLFLKIKLVLLEAFTSEHAARSIAMKYATENAFEMLEGLVLLRNKVRQANITKDILEIISSAEALKA